MNKVEKVSLLQGILISVAIGLIMYGLAFLAFRS